MKKILLFFYIVFMVQGIFSQEAPDAPPTFVENTIKLQEDVQRIKTELSSLQSLRKETDLLWMCLSAFLVFFMQAGFALVEAGFTREKNTVNILMKNITDFAVASIIFWLLGFSLMFGKQIIQGVGLGSLSPADALINTNEKPDSFKYAFFFFQLVFAGTSATIVSGAAAERMKFQAYLIFSIILTALIYPIFGSFVWSGLFDPANKGFLEKMGFIDFAGSTVVHSVGGWAGLAATLIIGPRVGRFSAGGVAHPILGHNMTIATLGVFILWLGWFGFNPGSTLVVANGNFAIVAVTTNASAAAAFISSMITSWFLFKMPDLSMSLNGALAGLVAITAGCANVSIGGAIVIGTIAGILVVFSVMFFDKIRVDDPVGAISVHGVCGLWGTVAVGLFANGNFGGAQGLFYGGGLNLLSIQILGATIAFVWTFSISLLLFFIVKQTVGVRVSEEEEIAGLDILEHGNEAYPLSK
jgi:ammonium transporter, Amt family